MQKKIIYLKKWKILKKQYTGKSQTILGNYSLKSLNSIKLTEKHYQTLMLFIRKFFKKKSFFHYKVNKVSRTSTKSLGMRMGKGKGKKRITFFLISQGNFFLEIGISKLRTKRDFLIFYKQISQKLPFRVQKLDSLNLFNSL